MTEKLQLHAHISGRVQGVGFRYYVQREASSLLLTGWVRNLRNGNVEMCAEGPKEELLKLLVKLKRGSPSSFVLDVDYRIGPELSGHTGFKILPTI